VAAAAETCHRQAIHCQRCFANVHPVKFGSPKAALHRTVYHVRITKKRGFNRERRAVTAKSHYIRSMMVFSVTLGRIAATHLSSSGK
jgi:hypothetical protein